MYRKASHSNRYLTFDLEHPMCTKRAVATNLYRRAEALSSSEMEKEKEKQLVTSILRANGYSKHVLRQAQRLTRVTPTGDKEWISTVVIPYRRTTSDDIRRILNKFNIKVAFQATNTLRRKLVKLKDPLSDSEKSDCVYRLNCADCEACYIGQTARQLDVRVKEHKRCTKTRPNNPISLKKLENDSAIAAHALLNEHRVNFDQPSVLKQGFHTHKERLLTEALLINSTASAVNRSDGADLSPIWQAILSS